MSKKKSSFLNMITMFIYQFIAIINGFILPKLLLNSFGVELHGYTSTVSSLINYISLLNAGLSVTAIQALYKPLAEKNNNEVNSTLNAIKKFYIRTGLYYTIAVVSISFILPCVIKENIPYLTIFFLMIVMGATNILECFCYSKSMTLLQADQKLYIVNIANACSIIIRLLIQVVLIKTGFNIVIVEMIPATLVFFRAFIINKYISKNYSYLDSKVLPNNNALSKRWSAFVHHISNLVVNNTDVMLLTIFTNLSYVSIYSIYNLVFSHLYVLLNNIFSHGTIASFGALLNENKNDKLVNAFNLYELLYYIAISIVYSITAVMILPFVAIYTKGISNIPYVDLKLAILFVIISIMSNLRVPCGTMINAAGHYKETKNRAITEALINIIMSLILVKPFGIYGLLIGTICSFIYRSFDIIIYSNKYILKRKVFLTIRKIFLVILSIAISVLIFCLIPKPVFELKWIYWIIYAIIISIISTLVTIIIFIVAENKEFKQLLIQLYNIFDRRKYEKKNT